MPSLNGFDVFEVDKQRLDVYLKLSNIELYKHYHNGYEFEFNLTTKMCTRLFVERGVDENKILCSFESNSDCCSWSLSKSCFVDCFLDENGEVSSDVRMLIFEHKNILTKKDIDKINNSNGIIISCGTYGRYPLGFVN
jgi:hypothetical protein